MRTALGAPERSLELPVAHGLNANHHVPVAQFKGPALARNALKALEVNDCRVVAGNDRRAAKALRQLVQGLVRRAAHADRLRAQLLPRGSGGLVLGQKAHHAIAVVGGRQNPGRQLDAARGDVLALVLGDGVHGVFGQAHHHLAPVDHALGVARGSPVGVRDLAAFGGQRGVPGLGIAALGLLNPRGVFPNGVGGFALAGVPRIKRRLVLLGQFLANGQPLVLGQALEVGVVLGGLEVAFVQHVADGGLGAAAAALHAERFVVLGAVAHRGRRSVVLEARRGLDLLAEIGQSLAVVQHLELAIARHVERDAPALIGCLFHQRVVVVEHHLSSALPVGEVVVLHHLLQLLFGWLSPHRGAEPIFRRLGNGRVDLGQQIGLHLRRLPPLVLGGL